MTEDSHASGLRERVIGAILANRHPGWHFPGHFLGIRYDQASDRDTRLSCASRPEFLTEEGRLDFAVVAIVCDLALAACTRNRFGLSNRLATLNLSIYLHGPLGHADIQARSRLLSQNPSLHAAMAYADAFSGEELQASAVANFLAIPSDKPLNATPLPRDRPPDLATEQPLPELTEDEGLILRRADTAAADGLPGFTKRLWRCDYERNSAGVEGRFDTGSHAGNRAGHTQGGLMAGLAAGAAVASAGEGYRISALHANYLRPGRGARLQVLGACQHRGSTTASATVEVRDEQGRPLLSGLAALVRD